MKKLAILFILFCLPAKALGQTPEMETYRLHTYPHMTLAQTELPPHLQPGEDLTEDIDPDIIEHPEEPIDIEPVPPLICENGEVPTCDPVSDWWCDARSACFVYPWSWSDVYAPPEISPLGITQPWHDHWKSLGDNLDAHKHELFLWRTGGLTYIPPLVTDSCDVLESWGGGDLWKPASDNTGQPVVLIGGEFEGSTCQVVTPEGDVPCSYRTVANGGRAHFDVRTYCSALSTPLIFRAVNNGLGHCWEVASNPCKRHE